MSAAAGLLAGTALGCIGWFTRPNLARRRAVNNLAAADNAAATSAAVPTALSLSTFVDIVMVGVSSGLSVMAALRLAAREGPQPLGQHLEELLEHDELSLADALDEFGRLCGPRASPFIEALASSIRYGIPLVPSLERIQQDLRNQTRRGIEKRVRQLPVRMLFPLVFCVLPALGLVGVVPVLVAAFRL